MGSVGSREAALPFAFGQPRRVSDDRSQLQGAAGPRPAGESGLLWCQRSIWAHSSLVSFGRHLAPPRQAAATGGPRRRSIRRRIAANTARGTATSASWNTRYRPWRTIRAPILASFSHSVLSEHCATSFGSARLRRKFARL